MFDVIDVRISTPSFDGSGFLVANDLFPSSQEVTLTLKIRPAQGNGLLVFNKKDGDFFGKLHEYNLCKGHQSVSV